MKTVKKILMILLAILPVAVVIVYTISGMMTAQKPTLNDVRMGKVTIVDSSSHIYVECEQNTLSYYLITPWIPAGAKVTKGFTFTMLQLLEKMQTAGLLTVNAYVVIAMIYLQYYIIIGLISIVLDLITLPVKLVERWITKV